MKVYVLTDGQYEQEVAGVFASAEAAMSERPDLDWGEYGDLDDKALSIYWIGTKDRHDMSRVFGFELQFADPQTYRLPFDLKRPDAGATVEMKMAPLPLTIPVADTVLEALEELGEREGQDREQAYLLARLKEAGPGERERAGALLRAVADTWFEPHCEQDS